MSVAVGSPKLGNNLAAGLSMVEHIAAIAAQADWHLRAFYRALGKRRCGRRRRERSQFGVEGN